MQVVGSRLLNFLGHAWHMDPVRQIIKKCEGFNINLFLKYETREAIPVRHRVKCRGSLGFCLKIPTLRCRARAASLVIV